MNKNVQNYLENNAAEQQNTNASALSIMQTVSKLLEDLKTKSAESIKNAQTWLATQGEAAKEALQNCTGKAAKQALKMIFALTLALTMAISFSGCEDRRYHGDPTAPIDPYEHEEDCPNYGEDYNGWCEYCEPYK